MEHRDTRVEDFVVGKSPLMQDVFAQIKAAADSTGNVLLNGESGTGKDQAARYIHRNSERAEGPFVPVNCGAIPKELFESELFGHVKGAFTGAVSDTAGLFTAANGGTIFLDEVTEIPSEMQVKLLRVLQDSRIRALGSTEEVPLDVRVIAATNRNLKQALARGVLRQDLFFRLNVINIEMPRLRDRLEDLPDLVSHFIEKLNRRFDRHVRGVEMDVLEQLGKFAWRGNLRQLENTLENAFGFTKGDWITRIDVREKEEVARELRVTITQEQHSHEDVFVNALPVSIRQKILTAARANQAVLIFGEGGAGCTTVAREIHQQSQLRNGPFVKVFCDAIAPERFDDEFLGKSLADEDETGVDGYLQQAAGGTLFLYEFTALPNRMQVMISSLMDIEQGGVPANFVPSLPSNVRIIAYTSQDLNRALQEGSLTVRLYSRLTGFSIYTPALRQNPERILELVTHFVQNAVGDGCAVDERAMACLKAYSWPGNYLEMNYVVEGALSASNFKTIQERHLPDHVRFYQKPAGAAEGNLREVTSNLEQRLLQETLQKADGNKARAARMLGISRKKLYSMLQASDTQ